MTVRSGLFPAIDHAAFATALGMRLRGLGAGVGPTAISDLVLALQAAFPRTRDELYWLARVTLVSTKDDLAIFDHVFAAVFDGASLPTDPAARRRPQELPPSAGRPAQQRPGLGPSDDVRSSVPWVTPRAAHASPEPTQERLMPELRPSTLAGWAELPFERLDELQLEELGRWVQRTEPDWPMRRHRRTSPDPRGRRVALRRTLTRARRTGLEPVVLARESPTPRPRRVVMIIDVSQSMQSCTTAYLHLMRVLVRHRDAEIFAFGTQLSRMTTELRDSSVVAAIDAATEAVTDRFGGTRIATNLQRLLDSRHASLLRGAVVVIASDGWDGDPPDWMSSAMARLARRAYRVVWLNPRAAAPGFAPDVGSMAAALPHCDRMLAAGTFASLRDAITQIGRLTEPASARGSRGSMAGTVR